jgi:hypothetical protein
MNPVPAKYEAELIGIDQTLIELQAGTEASKERASTIFRNIISQFLTIKLHAYTVLTMYYSSYLVFNYERNIKTGFKRPVPQYDRRPASWSKFLTTDHEVPWFESQLYHGGFSLKSKIPMVTMVWVV